MSTTREDDDSAGSDHRWPTASCAAQEVVGSDDSALQAVVAADVELMQLRQEEAEILARQDTEENGLEAGNATTPSADNDNDADRLNEIYERMQASAQDERTSKTNHSVTSLHALG